jgi:hypothetical protein
LPAFFIVKPLSLRANSIGTGSILTLIEMVIKRFTTFSSGTPNGAKIRLDPKIMGEVSFWDGVLG